MDYFAFTEIVTAVVMVLGGQKGFEIYKRRKHSNGRHDRRNSSRENNSFADSDKDFIRECFENQTKELGKSMETSDLKLVLEFGKVIRNEGEKTRSVVRSR